MANPYAPLAERLWGKIKKTENCWIWQGATRGQTEAKKRGAISIKGRTTSVHRLVYELLVGPIPEGTDLLHKCGNGLCVNPDHLKVGNDRENARDRDTDGRTAVGSRNGSAKLTPEQVQAIRRDYETDIPNQSKLARQYGISSSQVQKIVNGKLWKHV